MIISSEPTRQITQSGIYYNIAEKDYHADPCPTASFSSSIGAILLNQSPQHAWTAHPKLNPQYEPTTARHFDIGNIAHSLFLQGIDRAHQCDFRDWRTNDAKDMRDAARDAGEIPILTKDYHHIFKMVEIAHKFLETTELKGLMKCGKPEVTFCWMSMSVISRMFWSKARLDWLQDDSKVILDYKTTTIAEPGTFTSKIISNDYHLQAVNYQRAVGALSHEIPEYFWLVQEISPPYGCSLVGLSERMKDLGTQRLERAQSIWAECLKIDHWPGYTTRTCFAEPPEWAIYREEEQLVLHEELNP